MTPELTVTSIGKSRWLFATCKEIPEVMIHGSNMTQIMARAPGIIDRALERRLTTGRGQAKTGEATPTNR
jgi:hypothetical protein